MKPPITQISIPSNKYGQGRAYKISQISEHHVVGDAQHVINKAKGSAIFSTTFTIGTDGTIYQLVDLNNTPYCDNDYRSNGRSITIEHAGGGNFPYTEAMYQSSIKLHKWLFSIYGNLNCVKHREIPEIVAQPSKATACPGTLDVARIINEAKGDSMADHFTKAQVNQLTQIAYNAPATDAQKSVYSAEKVDVVLDKVLKDPKQLDFRTKAQNFDQVVAALKNDTSAEQKLNQIKEIVK